MPSETSTRKASAASKKGLIREAAVRVIADRGFYAATTDQIAAEAGISVGTIYNYFRNKEEILSHIFEIEMARRLHWLEECSQDGKTPRDALAMFLRRHFEAVAKEPEVARILVRERSFARGHDPLALKGYLEELPGRLMRLIQSGQASGAIRPIDPRTAATALFGAVESLTREVVERESYETFLDQLDDVVAFFWKGLAADI